MGKNEDAHYEELESLVSILIDEVATLKEQNRVIAQVVTKLKDVSEKPRKLEYILDATGLDQKVEESKGFVREITSSIRHARSILDTGYLPKWLQWFIACSSLGFVISAFVLWIVIDDVFYASEFRDFVFSDDRVFEFFLEWKKKQ